MNLASVQYLNKKSHGQNHSFKGQCLEIFCFWFFSWIHFPQASDNSISFIWNFSNIRGDICNLRCTTCINDTGGKFATNTAGVVDTGATGVIDTGGK